jgi:hypothetical protein
MVGSQLNPGRMPPVVNRSGTKADEIAALVDQFMKAQK